MSVVICAKDESKNLASHLPFVVRQQYDGSLQVLIVNDNSEDDTKYLLQELRQTYKNITVLNLKNEAKPMAGKKFPLAIGIREARHEILLLTDADCVPASENWVQKMQDAYEDHIDIVLGYGAYKKLPGFLNKVIRFETFHAALQYFSYALAGLPYMGVGRNLSYKKNLFLKHKGFSSVNHLPGGDDDLFINKAATKINTAIVTDVQAHTISMPKTSWKNWRRQKTRHFSTSKYYKPKHKFLLGLFSFSHFLFYPAAIAAALFSNLQIAGAAVVVKSAVQFVVYAKVMRKLNESDLIKWMFVLDIWMLAYYIYFAPALWKKAKKHW